MSNTFQILNGIATFVSGAISSASIDEISADKIKGKWEVDPDDNESIQFRIPSASFGGNNDRIGFYFSASGEVGIGTKDPESAFDVRDLQEDVDVEDREAKTKIFQLRRNSQKFDQPVTASIVSASTIVGNLTGNADTATTLETARTIGGVSFNGSANINLPGVNTTGNQATTGNAGSATKVTVTADELNASHPLTFIDDTTPDGQAESLKASRVVTVNPGGSSMTIGGLTITYTQGDGRSTFGTVTFSGVDAGGSERSVTLRME